jgi:hypothetical protein
MELDAEELTRRIAEGEGKTLEFKRGLPGDAKLARTLAAFANTRGGLLLIGIGDRGERYGAPRPRETLAEVRRVAREAVEPPLELQGGIVTLDGERIVWCSVPLSPARPHASLDAEGERELVVRVGSSNRRASEATLKALRAQVAGGSSLDVLERSILAWLAARGKSEHGATLEEFVRARNIGRQRARRAFTRLELGGRVVGHGAGARRRYALAGE